MRDDHHDGDEEEGGVPDPSPAPAPPPPRFGRVARTLLLGAATALAFVVGAAVTAVVTDDGSADAPSRAADNPGGALEDRIAPDASAPLPAVTLDGFADGEPVDLAGYRGRPLVVNFWASWCAPCVKEMPDFEAVSRDLAGAVPVLGVNVQDAPANAEAFVEDLGITYDLAADPKGELYTDVEAFGMPTTLFVDADGLIRYRYTGTLDADELRGLVAEHLDVDA